MNQRLVYYQRGVKNLIDQVQGGASLADAVKGSAQDLGQGLKTGINQSL